MAPTAGLLSRSFAVLHRSAHPTAPAVPAAQDDELSGTTWTIG
jgi:hypothetical protein